MTTIDLLPEELRDNDAENKKTSPKDSEDISYVYPKNESIPQSPRDKKVKAKKGSFFSRLFGSKKKGSTSDDLPKMHLPKEELMSDSESVDLLDINQKHDVVKKEDTSLKVARDASDSSMEKRISLPKGGSTFSGTTIKRLPKPSMWTRILLGLKSLFPKKKKKKLPRLHKHSLAVYKDAPKKKTDSTVAARADIKELKHDAPKKPTDDTVDIKTQDEDLEKNKSVNKSKESVSVEKEKADKKKDDSKKADRDVPKYSKSEYDVNLIPREMIAQRELAVPRRITASSIIMLIGIVVGVLSYLGALAFHKSIFSKADALAVQISSVDAAITQQQALLKDASQLQERLQSIGALLDNHMYWTQFFENLEEVTHEDVYFAGFSMAGTESLSLSGYAPSYSVVAEQLVALQQADEFIAKAVINSAQATAGEEVEDFTVSFRVDLMLVPGIFTK